MGKPNRWKLKLAGVALLPLALASIYMNRQLTPTVAWETDVSAALARGRESGTLVLLAFTGPGCPSCWKMERSVFPSEPVERELDAYVPVHVDTDADYDTTVRFGIEGIPAFVIVSPDGTIVDRATGYQNVSEFSSFLRRAAASASASSGS